MSIASEITRLETAVANITTAVSGMGGDVSSVSSVDDLPTAVETIPSGGFTGHVDEAGLAAIGWDADDIAWLQSNVWWNEEDDTLYTVLNETKETFQSFSYDFPEFSFAVGELYCPKLDLLQMEGIVFQCSSNIVALPLLNMSRFTDVFFTFCTFSALRLIRGLNLLSATNLEGAFASTYGIQKFEIPMPSMVDCNYLFDNCHSLVKVILDVSSASNMNNSFNGCSALRELYLSNLGCDIGLVDCRNLTHDSLMYLINNAQTITEKLMQLGPTNGQKLTDEEIAIATNKGWTVSINDAAAEM